MLFSEIKEDMEKIFIGEIVTAVGIKGEVKVKSYAESSDNYSSFGHIYLGEDACDPCKIEKARTHGDGRGNMVVLKLEGVEDRNRAEELIGLKLFIDETQLKELPDDTYYVRDLIGLKVFAFDSVENKVKDQVGVITDVIQNTAQDVYVINDSIMVPAVKEFVKEVNLSEGYVAISFIEGML